MASPAGERERPASPEEASQRTPPPSSLHKRRFDAKRGELPETLTVRAQPPPEEAGTSPEAETPRDLDAVCERMLRRLEGRTDPLAARSRRAALATRGTADALDHLEKLYELMDRLLQLKQHNERALRRARDAQFVLDLAAAHRQIEEATERARREGRELELQNEALDMDLDAEYGYTEALLESLLAAGRGASVRRAGSRWRARKLRGSLLGERRSRSVGGEESEGGGGEARLSVPPPKPRRASDQCKVDKSKVSKWTKVKAAFRWEKAHTGVAAGAVGAAGALVGAVALAGTSAPTTPVTPPPQPQPQPQPEEPRDSVSVTPGSLLSLTPNSSCEELRMDSGACRKSGRDENDNTFLQAPIQDDSSTSPSPNKMHKTPWGKMRDIIHTRKESVRRKQRSLRSSGVPPPGRRSFSDGGESDAPPALTVTVPSSEELESEPTTAVGGHVALRKQRSLELGGAARPPPARRDPARPSKWSKVKRAFLTGASASVPCSPDHHRQFFADREMEAVSSGCEASGVRDEIQRDYAALQSRLGREFSDKRGKLYGMRPVATEEQLSADFRKKLAEWQRMKSGGGGAGSSRQPPPVPDRSDLSDDFLKKWDEWKRLKETNSVPTWAEEARPDEVLVQTSAGYIRFQGVTRSFTRKLHEWEKARGIAPEASTSALLRAARTARAAGPASAPLARAQSAGSVAAAAAAPPPRAHHASSLSVNDADDLEMHYGHDDHSEGGGGDEAGSGAEGDRGAVLVEVEAEEVCTAAPLVVASPRHTPQTPVYTYDHAEPARLLCETSSAALLQQEPVTSRAAAERVYLRKDKNAVFGSLPRGPKNNEKKDRRAIIRQPSLEDDAQFIRRTIEEIERGSSSRVDINDEDSPKMYNQMDKKSREQVLSHDKFHKVEDVESSSSTFRKVSGDIREDDGVEDDRNYRTSRKNKDDESGERDNDESSKRKELMEKGTNGKKKNKARARLEREHSKPSASDSEHDLDTVTVEIPRRRKRPRRPSEKPRTPPISASAASDTEGEVFVLKLRAPEQQRCVSPEVIVKTKRKIFSPVVRSGEITPRAVIPVDVEELAGVRPHENVKGNHTEEPVEIRVKGGRTHSRKSQEDLAETRSRLQVALEGDGVDDHRPRSRPPLPSSPLSQRRHLAKETAPAIRIMIQRYNLKLNEDGHTSPVSSGASSPAWRSPAAERRRPPDMPHPVNIRNNPFVAREVQKSVSACQLSRQEVNSVERRLEVPSTEAVTKDRVLKSHSACALHPVEKNQRPSPSPMPLREESEFEVKPNASIASTSLTSIETSASTPNSPLTPYEGPSIDRKPGDCPWRTKKANPPRPLMERFLSTTSTGSVSRMSLERIMSGISRDKRPSVERMLSRISTDTTVEECAAPKETMTPSERALRIRAARERFLSSPGPARRDLSGSAGELRPGDSAGRGRRRRCARDCIGACCRSSRASCGDASDVGGGGAGGAGAPLGRSASTGMVNVERGAWERVCEGGGEQGARRGRFSLARLAARFRRRADPGAVSRLCRQSLLVHVPPQQH